MKHQRIVFLIVVLISLMMNSCNLLDTDDHSVRVRNSYSLSLHVKIGSNDYGTVSSGTTTDYKHIDAGTHQISGDVSGSMTVKGSGTHKWTVLISASGSLSISED